jgi:hypothetical protein
MKQKNQPLDHQRIGFLFVDLLGFEPRQTEPKSVVLPLHHKSIFQLAESAFSESEAKVIPLARLRKHCANIF